MSDVYRSCINLQDFSVTMNVKYLENDTR